MPDDPPVIDETVPHSARVWNYWLGGTDHFEVDRIAGEQFRQAFPAIADNAREFRRFLRRGVRYLTADAGVRQFLDVGAGLPTASNTHQIAQEIAPESRVVYVDHDPLVQAHARALLTSSPEGATDYLHADLRDTDAILTGAARTLDLDEPVALILSGILAHVADHAEACAVVGRLVGALAPGSHLLVCDGSDTNAELNAAQREHNDRGAVVYHLRSPAQIAGYFAGLELVDPGVVPCSQWRPDPADDPAPVDSYGAVGRKP
jgi:O-methyltransferase involved in polyketide biosynthesis